MSAAGLLFGVDDRPPLALALLTAFQHLLAIFVGIVTPPLIICAALDVSPAETAAMVSLALFVSGIATVLQTIGVGPAGSRLLSVQGTSFAFIGPIVFMHESLAQRLGPDAVLGTVFGTTLIGGLAVVVASRFLDRLGRAVTPAVTATTVALLGLTLVQVTIDSVLAQHQVLTHAGLSPASLWIQFGAVAATVFLLHWSRNPWIRLAAIALGLAVGYACAAALGVLDLSAVGGSAAIIVPRPLRYPLQFDLLLFLVLIPAYIVCMAESIGDLTATSALSLRPVVGPAYWDRLKRGVLADGLNSMLAAVFCTFPNTTFSQNNGVIRLTGVASRYVGAWVGVLLIAVGIVPVMGTVIQAMPRPVLDGVTLLMFIHVALAGPRILLATRATRASWVVGALAIAGAYTIKYVTVGMDDIPQLLRSLLEYPVATGALLAIVIDWLRRQTLATPIESLEVP